MEYCVATARVVLGAVGLSFLLLPFAGCGGSDRAYVTGTILRQDGTPLVNARVIARIKTGVGSANGVTDEQGRYALGIEEEGYGIPPGDYYVIVMEDRGNENVFRPPTIAEKYAKRSSSGLEFSVQAGETKVFELKLDQP